MTTRLAAHEQKWVKRKKGLVSNETSNHELENCTFFAKLRPLKNKAMSGVRKKKKKPSLSKVQENGSF